MTDERQLEQREEKLKERLEQLEALERQIKERETKAKQKESARKQIVLRLSPSLWSKLAERAEQDFRSINGEIEYLLTRALNEGDKNG